MLNLKQVYQSAKKNLHIQIFELSQEIKRQIKLSEKKRLRISELFRSRIKAYAVFVVFFYIFQSHLDYMMYENLEFVNKYITCYRDFIWRDRSFFFFIACFIVYTIYFLISLVSLKLYDYISLIAKSIWMIFFLFTFKYYAWFYELELNYFYDEGNFFTLFVLYFFMYWGSHALEFGYNLEEEFDDPRWNLLNVEAEKAGTFQGIFGWFHTGLSEKKEAMISKITDKDRLLLQIFGDADDYGEEVWQTFDKFKEHKKRMYPDLIHLDDLPDEEREIVLLDRRHTDTPIDIEETIEWRHYDPEHKITNFYPLKIKPFFHKYRRFFWGISVFKEWRKLGTFRRPRAVGLYSFYNPKPTRKFNKTWSIFERINFFVQVPIPFVKRYISLKPVYLSFRRLNNKVKKISLFRFINNLKWSNFHFKHYPKIKKLRKWGSINYKFFKAKNT